MPAPGEVVPKFRGVPETRLQVVDFLASKLNNKLHAFLSRYRVALVEEGDTLVAQWDQYT